MALTNGDFRYVNRIGNVTRNDRLIVNKKPIETRSFSGIFYICTFVKVYVQQAVLVQRQVVSHKVHEFLRSRTVMKAVGTRCLRKYYNHLAAIVTIHRWSHDLLRTVQK